MIGRNLRRIISRLLLMFCILKRKNTSCLCLKQNSNRENQIILLTIPNGEGWHYPAVKKQE